MVSYYFLLEDVPQMTNRYKKGGLKGGSSGKWNMNCMRVMSPGIRVRRGGKYEDGEVMDSFLIIRLHSRTFCLEQREQRVCQFKPEVSTADHRFVHNFAA